MPPSAPDKANLHPAAASVPTPVVNQVIPQLFALTKPRLSFLSILTALVGYLAANPDRNFPTLAALIFGTSLCAGGAAALNQWWERDADARMARTRTRPLPGRMLTPVAALVFGLAISILGTLVLALGINLLSAGLAALTIASYVLAYTPLKKVSVHNTLVGALPGAIPPLIGWSAATGGIAPLAWLLFAILFFWQMPHFYAIAWIYRDDYREAGFRMLPLLDPSGHRTALEALLYTVVLVAISLALVPLGFATPIFGLGALLCGAFMLRSAWRFFGKPTHRTKNARGLFLASILYLPILFAALIADRLLLL